MNNHQYILYFIMEIGIELDVNVKLGINDLGKNFLKYYLTNCLNKIQISHTLRK